MATQGSPDTKSMTARLILKSHLKYGESFSVFSTLDPGIEQ